MREESAGRREPWLGRWSRRALTILGVFLASNALLASSPALALLTISIDLVDRRRPWARTRFLLASLVYFWAEWIGLLLSFAVWLISPFGSHEQFLDRNRRLQVGWIHLLFEACRRLFRIKVELEGLERADTGPLLLFARHVSLADTLLPAVFIARPFGMRLRYVLKEELRWDPCLDVVGQRLPNVFVRRVAEDSEAEVDEVRRLARGLGPRDAVLIFPEGTRFSHERLARAKERGIAHAQSYRNVLPPRLGGPLALIDEASEVDIALIAHQGLESARTFKDLVNGALLDATLRVHLVRIPADEIPTDRTDRVEWLHRTWRQLDERVAALARD